MTQSNTSENFSILNRLDWAGRADRLPGRVRRRLAWRRPQLQQLNRPPEVPVQVDRRLLLRVSIVPLREKTHVPR